MARLIPVHINGQPCHIAADKIVSISPSEDAGKCEVCLVARGWVTVECPPAFLVKQADPAPAGGT